MTPVRRPAAVDVNASFRSAFYSPPPSCGRGTGERALLNSPMLRELDSNIERQREALRSERMRLESRRTRRRADGDERQALASAETCARADGGAPKEGTPKQLEFGIRAALAPRSYAVLNAGARLAGRMSAMIWSEAGPELDVD